MFRRLLSFLTATFTLQIERDRNITMLDKLRALEERYQEIESLMADPEVATDYERVQVLAKERASLKNGSLSIVSIVRWLKT